jgi:hypothetical protein
LSGALPFKGETVADHFVQIATADPIPLEVAAPHASRGASRIVAKCLKRSPAERYKDARTLLSDLEAVASESRAPKGQQLPLKAAEARREAATALGRPAPQPPGPSSGAMELEPLAAPSRAAGSPVRPVRVARFHSLRPALAEGLGRRLLVSIAVTLSSLAAAGLLATLNVWPEEWALSGWVTGLLAGLGPAGVRLFAAGAGVLASASAVRGWRREPKSLGHFVAALSVLVAGAVMLAASTGQLPWSAMPWAAAGIAVGVYAVAVRGATDAWLDDLQGDAVLRGAVAIAALVIARLLVR